MKSLALVSVAIVLLLLAGVLYYLVSIKTRNAPPWLRVVFRHYVRYLFLYRKIDEDTFAWLLVFVPGRSYPKETYLSEYSLEDIRRTFEKLYWFYRLVLESGARPEHVAEILGNWNARLLE